MFDVEKIREDFPILSREISGRPLIYLDNGATSQTPSCPPSGATVHRGRFVFGNYFYKRNNGGNQFGGFFFWR